VNFGDLNFCKHLYIATIPEIILTKGLVCIVFDIESFIPSNDKKKAMTVQQFQELTEVDQLKILIQFGILIGEITEKSTRIFMYQVQDFYVETRYTLETDDLISIDPFSKMERQDRSRWTILNLSPINKEKFPD
jgi:hypothetical protein